MKIARTPDGARRAVRAWRAAGETIGFVPTMGALHEGHASLMRRARRECDRLVASIFVNPLQFGPSEDYERYPRPMRADRAVLGAAGADLLYLPAVEAIYPPEFRTRVSVRGVSETLEGRERPGHFDGVATIVAKLLAAVEPDRLYLGQKDAQQAILLDRMVRDLDLGVRVVVCPTVREKDGLALSSRNAYLSAQERRWAPAIYAALRAAADALVAGEIEDPAEAEAMMQGMLRGGPGRLDYARAIDARTLEAPVSGRAILLAVAYRMPSARLIDNVIVPGRRGAADARPPRSRPRSARA